MVNFISNFLKKNSGICHLQYLNNRQQKQQNVNVNVKFVKFKKIKIYFVLAFSEKEKYVQPVTPQAKTKLC